MTSTSPSEASFGIGGEFGLTPADFLQPERNDRLLQPGRKHCLYLDTGRSAIYAALRSIIRRGGRREAWLPRYCCRSVLLPFELLGFRVRFYSSGSDLDSPSGLPDRLDGETFLLIHYFGFRNRALLAYLEQMKRQHRFFVVEDCVQALLTSNLGTHDYAVYSYRKFFPQPDGALLASDHSLAGIVPFPPDEAFISRRLIGKLIRNFETESTVFLDLFAAAEARIDRFSAPREMSLLSRYLLVRTDAGAIAGQRRDNYARLTAALGDRAGPKEFLHPLFPTLSSGEVPLGLPVVIDPAQRNRLRQFLAGQRIYCPVHWPQEGLDTTAWPEEQQLSRSLLTLPIDQRLNHPAIDYLAQKITDYAVQNKLS